MPVIRVRVNPQGPYEIRRAPGVRADLERRARAVQAAAGGAEAGYVVGSQQGRKDPQGRWRTSVATATAAAMADNARNHTLIRALGAARG